MHGGDNNMVPVDAPENKGLKPEGGQIDESHQMLQHQLINLKQNAEALLEHLSQCTCPHVQEEETKKKIILAADYLDSAQDFVMSSHGGETGPSDNDGFLVMVEKHMNQKPT